MKILLSLMLALFPALASAQLGPQSDWGDIYRNRFYSPDMPVVTFHAKSSNGVGSQLIFARVNEVSRFVGADGVEYLYGGTAEICNSYAVTGSLSDSDRVCLLKEKVELVRPRAYQFEFCVFRSDGDCAGYATSAKQYPLIYDVAVYRRLSESDAFHSGAPPAFTKRVQVRECADCAGRLR
ncbi:hypothetical protein O5O45_20775 [Hahella aquimaris]|uniref:hypothetical protein n=1 Tax=Hahella sp. HNIBRBA332 TaxID=3015983 RepID=UPI00273CC05C|nr:hypothetical protein [Hahella sp. HNIBRBA332]WLQ12163.1 hypothetical protein O5O45_20775 [Hahella sp. HNIBRBA332]